MLRQCVEGSFLLSAHLEKLSGIGHRGFDHLPRAEFLQIPYGMNVSKFYDRWIPIQLT